jgi:threonine dehydratase
VTVDPEEIETTLALLGPYIRTTPVVEVSGGDFGLADCSLIFKLELLQHAGSFKTRGAFSNLLRRKVPSAGVVAASGGNHGAAVAYAARRLGVPAAICVPAISSKAKTARIAAYGAELHIGGDRYADALALSQQWAAAHGAMQIHAFDQLETLLGQGTLGVELSRQVESPDTVICAVGGGGLISGIASWFRSRVRIVGVEPIEAPTMTYALNAGKPVDAPAGGIAADSLAPARIGELVYPIVKDHVERVVLVTDDAIVAAQRALWEVCRVVAEPGGAAPLAALLSDAYRPQAGERVVVVVSGGNTTAVDFG